MKYLILILLLTACGGERSFDTQSDNSRIDYSVVRQHFTGDYTKHSETNSCGGLSGFPEAFRVQSEPNSPYDRFDPRNHLIDPLKSILIRLMPNVDDRHEFTFLSEDLDPIFPFTLRRIDLNLIEIILPFGCGRVSYTRTIIVE